MLKWWWKVQLIGAEMALEEFEMDSNGNLSLQSKELRRELRSSVVYYRGKLNLKSANHLW